MFCRRPFRGFMGGPEPLAKETTITPPPAPKGSGAARSKAKEASWV